MPARVAADALGAVVSATGAKSWRLCLREAPRDLFVEAPEGFWVEPKREADGRCYRLNLQQAPDGAKPPIDVARDRGGRRRRRRDASHARRLRRSAALSAAPRGVDGRRRLCPMVTRRLAAKRRPRARRRGLGARLAGADGGADLRDGDGRRRDAADRIRAVDHAMEAGHRRRPAARSRATGRPSSRATSRSRSSPS